jgi:chemotaxis protein MotB
MWSKLLRLNVVVLGLLAVGGCCDQYQKKIDEMTLNKQDLEGQLQQLKGELDDKQAELTTAQNSLAALKGEKGQWAQQLENAKRSQSAQALPAGWEIRKGMMMTSLPVSVLFDPGKAVLRASASSKLSTVLSQIRSNFPGRDVYIVGHTDSDPIRRSKWQDNLELSLHRSAAVTRFMISHGLPSKQVVASGVGQYRPVVPNTSARGKEKNRRVEFWVLKPL